MIFSLEKKISIPKKSSPGDLPNSAEEWVAYVNNLHDRGLKTRSRYELQWVLNLAYLLGYQNLIFNPRTGSLKMPQNTERPLTINRVGSFIESRHAKLTKNRPVPRTIPNTTDEEDINAAKYADKGLLNLWRDEEFEDELDAFVMMGLICGSAFVKNVWNPFEGDFIEDFKTDAKEGVVSDELEKIFMGEISSKALSAFNIIPANDSIRTVRAQPWLIERGWVPVSDIEHWCPHLKGKLKKAKDEDRTEYEKIVDRLASPVSSGLGSTFHRTNDSVNSDVLVKTLWMRPNRQYEKGLVVCVTGDQLAYIDAKFPDDYGRNIYPFVKFSEKNDGFHFWQQSSIERLLSIQKAYNRLKQKKLKNTYLMANGKYLCPKGAQISEDSFTDEEGEIIEYNPSVPKPEQMAMAPLPQYAIELARELIVDFRDAGGQREASVTPPPNVTAGVAMQVMAELGDETLAPIIRRLARCYSTIGNQQLLLMNTNYVEDRKIKIIGEGNSAAIEWINGADFRHHTDVHIEVESLFPEFRGAKQQRLLDLWDRRILTDPKLMLEAFRFGNFDKILEKVEKLDDMVWLDINRIKKGQEPEITPYQNHLEYFAVMTDWIKSPEFLRLIPKRKELALAVLQAHMQYLVKSLPGGGEPIGQQNQASVGSPQGNIIPMGTQ